MAEQEQQRRTRRDDPGADPAAPPVVAAQARVQEVDSLLDEIDSVLEANAETFVQGFVQKGGQ